MSGLGACLWCGCPATTLVPACDDHGARDRVEGVNAVRGILVGVAIAGVLIAAVVLVGWLVT